MKAHEIAPHVGALICQVGPNDMRPAQIALGYAIDALAKAGPLKFDTSDFDRLVVHCLEIDCGSHSPQFKRAAELARMCVHIIERKFILDQEKIFVPQLLQAIAGFVPDKNADVGRRKRPGRSKPNSLSDGIEAALRANPDDGWLSLARWLMGDGVITRIEDREIWFVDDDTGREEAIKVTTFRNRLSKARKALQK